jgi:hypothetical protein
MWKIIKFIKIMSSKIILTDIELKDALKMYKKGIPKIQIARKYITTPAVIFRQLKAKYPHVNYPIY